eukprot:1148091-Pelagomonas_calceolata.AAC.3
MPRSRGYIASARSGKKKGLAGNNEERASQGLLYICVFCEANDLSLHISARANMLCGSSADKCHDGTARNLDVLPGGSVSSLSVLTERALSAC